MQHRLQKQSVLVVRVLLPCRASHPALALLVRRQMQTVLPVLPVLLVLLVRRQKRTALQAPPALLAPQELAHHQKQKVLQERLERVQQVRGRHQI